MNVDETQRENELMEETPLSWWSSTLNNFIVMAEAGVLSLPYAMSKLGW